MNHLELWIDGNKIGNFPGNTMSASVPLANGSHTATLVEVDSASNFIKSTPVTFTVGGTPPLRSTVFSGSDSVHTSRGQHGYFTGTIHRAGTGASGSVNHLELWVDGNKIGDFPGSTMSASVPLANGSHTATLIEVDSSSNFIKSTPVTFNVTGGRRRGTVAVTTYHNDLTREGANTAETTLTTSNVNSSSFGKLATLFGGRASLSSASDRPRARHQRWYA